MYSGPNDEGRAVFPFSAVKGGPAADPETRSADRASTPREESGEVGERNKLVNPLIRGNESDRGVSGHNEGQSPDRVSSGLETLEG